MKQGKLILIIAVTIVFFIVAAYAALNFYNIKMPWAGIIDDDQAPPLEKSGESQQYGTLPEIDSIENPLGNVPELNPVESANPFKNLIKNPFE